MVGDRAPTVRPAAPAPIPPRSRPTVGRCEVDGSTRRDGRGVLHTDVTGCDVTVAGPDAAHRWDRAIEGWLTYAPDVLHLLDEALAADPQLALAQALRAWMLHGTHDPQEDAEVSASLGAAEAAIEVSTERERTLVAAIGADVRGHAGAGHAWARALQGGEPDLVASRCAYFHHYERGEATSTARVATEALARWPRDDRWHPVVEGMAAFALSEVDDERSETLGRRAAARAPWDLWSLHAVVHVLEDGARATDGAAWVDQHAGWLDPAIGFARHLWWHAALFELARGDPDAALALFDGPVGAGSSDGHLDLTNQISLLARLEDVGVATADRWDRLADAAARRIHDRRSKLLHVHLAVALARASDDRTEELLVSTRRWAASDPLARRVVEPVVARITREVPGHDLGSGGSVDAALLDGLGGSRAQRRLLLGLATGGAR